MDHSNPILVTLTSPTAAGKSHLYNYIRDVAKLPCLVSTTTRQPRVGEVEGLDYFFISEEESKRLEQEDLFAELAVYGGVRYGVTKTEFYSKLKEGLVFLIVEPTGIEHYAKPATDAGASHFKIFVDTPLETRIDRFKTRAFADINAAHDRESSREIVNSTVASYLKRFESMLTNELAWKDMVEWDAIVDGRKTPKDNLYDILMDLAMLS